MTRSLAFACRWARLDRRDPQQEGPSVLVFDRDALTTRYRIECAHDPIWSPDAVGKFDEMEERVWPHLVDVQRYVLRTIRIV
ncbi:hypothetical protein [Prosthecomicrobium sp. N25]|uniref:hypothetical protein n=1 Tax=Prosthecomicrobium sp. N25 TaxID=3129254 RepID=UPI0030772C65